VDRDNSVNGDPSLANMTRKAIEILQKNPHGFFLFIEGKTHFFSFYRAD
jgi:alkaline phosphatase